MYGGTPQGELFKFLAPDFKDKKLLLQRTTWPLSGTFNPIDGLMYLADPFIGLLSLKLEGDTVVEEKIVLHMNFANQVSVGPDGMVYVTDSFSRNNPTFTKMANFYHEMFSGAATGQLIQYDPRTQTSKVLIDSSSGSLRIGNGVAVSKDNKYIYVQGKFVMRQAVIVLGIQRMLTIRLSLCVHWSQECWMAPLGVIPSRLDKWMICIGLLLVVIQIIL
jgi:hypothetical protein